MTMNLVGYAYLVQTMQLAAIPLKRSAVVKPVKRVTLIGDMLSVPPSVAPAEGAMLEHIQFALKHEGINLTVLAQALRRIPAHEVLAVWQAAPTSTYARKICFLWEAFNERLLDCKGSPKGAIATLFDPQHYITGPSVRNPRWRIDFNGLGSLAWCVTVERTQKIDQVLASDVLGRCRAFMASLPGSMMDRAMSWAYLHETSDSFAIEKEAPSEGKAQRFIQLLRQAHERQPLTEDYLVKLQNSTINNPFDQAVAFRHQQNYLSNGLRGAAGVSYVPPSAELCDKLMAQLITFANGHARQIEPLVSAAIISFGFVFIHPFMDGNGRLSRFLIHHALCASGAMENGLLLPVSVAMKREEQRYLQALQAYSRPMRDFWSVQWLDGEEFRFEFLGDEALYRYWDGTAAVEFVMDMAERALDVELRDETRFLARYDQVLKAVDERYDVRTSLLSTLVMMCLDNQGVMSQNRRKQYRHQVPEELFDYLESQAALALNTPDE